MVRDESKEVAATGVRYAHTQSGNSAPLRYALIFDDIAWVGKVQVYDALTISRGKQHPAAMLDRNTGRTTQCHSLIY